MVNSPRERNCQVLEAATQDQTQRAGFRGFNPKMSGENSLQKSVQVRRLPGVQSRRRGGCWAILSEGFRPRPRALRRYAARRGEEAGEEGRAARAPAPPPSSWMPPPFGLDGDPGRAPASASWLGSAPAGARLVDGSCPRPHCPLPPAHSAPTDRGGPGPSTGPSPGGCPGPQSQPNGFRGASSGAGRGSDGSVSPAFRGGSVRALTSDSRRSEAEEGGSSGASS